MAVPLIPIAVGLGGAAAAVGVAKLIRDGRRKHRGGGGAHPKAPGRPQPPRTPPPKQGPPAAAAAASNQGQTQEFGDWQFDHDQSELEDLLEDNEETPQFGKWQCDCNPRKTPPRKNLYVIKLRPEVWELEARFRDGNRHYRPETGKPCVYVGETAHEPVCRFAQHLKPHYWDTFATTYGTRLMPKEFKHRNQVPADQAERLQNELALELRGRGWAAWC